MIVDTDILIWYLRGNEKAYAFIHQLPDFYISAVTYMELVQGMRNQKELNQLKQFLRTHQIKVIYISESICMNAIFLVEQYYLSHSLQLADVLIAATALDYGLTLATANDKHYKIIKGLQILKFIPQ